MVPVINSSLCEDFAGTGGKRETLVISHWRTATAKKSAIRANAEIINLIDECHQDILFQSCGEPSSLTKLYTAFLFA